MWSTIEGGNPRTVKYLDSLAEKRESSKSPSTRGIFVRTNHEGESVRRFTILAIGSLAIVLAACGSGGGSDEPADVAVLESCVSDALPTYEVSSSRDELDLISQEATVGAFSVKSDLQEIQISALAESRETEALVNGYEAFGLSPEVIGTVVVAPNIEMSDEESDAIMDCLDQQGIS